MCCLRVAAGHNGSIRASPVNIFKDAPHQSLRNGVRAAREVVRRNGGCVIDAFDLEISSVLFAEFVAERLADDGALWSPLALSLFDMFGNLFGDSPCCRLRLSHGPRRKRLCRRKSYVRIRSRKAWCGLAGVERLLEGGRWRWRPVQELGRNAWWGLWGADGGWPGWMK
jgi:hypothetical protein